MIRRLVSIVVPTHNRSDLLKRTLVDVEQLLIPDGIDCEVIVVANVCTDDTGDVVSQHGKRASVRTRCIIEPQAGLNRARNTGLRSARGDFILFLDDDVRLDPALLQGMLDAYDHNDADLVGARVSLLWEAVDRPPWLPDDLLWVLSNAELGDDTHESPNGEGLIGACFGFRRRVTEAIGEFRPGLDRVGNRLLGGGETEFIQRALQKGFKAVHAPAMRVQHWVAPNRITPAYILGVCAGSGEARIYLKRRFGPATGIRALFGHLWLYGFHSVAATLTRDGTIGIRHKSRAAMGRGGLRGLAARCLGRAPQG